MDFTRKFTQNRLFHAVFSILKTYKTFEVLRKIFQKMRYTLIKNYTDPVTNSNLQFSDTLIRITLSIGKTGGKRVSFGFIVSRARRTKTTGSDPAGDIEPLGHISRHARRVCLGVKVTHRRRDESNIICHTYSRRVVQKLQADV